KLVKDAKVVESEGRHAEKQAEIYNLDLDHSSKVLSMQEDDSEVQEVVEVVTTAKLITEVITVAASQVSAASTTIPVASAIVPAAKPTIPAAAPIVVAAYTRKRKGVIIRDPEEELSLKTPVETPKVKDKGKGILVETPKPLKKKDQIEMDAEYARKLQEEIDRDHDGFNKDIDRDAAMDHVNKKNPGIKREFSVPRTPQQNGIAERKNKTLIEAARTLLADSLLPIPFWAEAVNTACYVQNRVLVTKPHNKTPYELLHGRLPSIGFVRPFGCPVTILNTLDPLGKFQGKVDEGFLVGYSVCSKAFRTMNYHPVLAEDQSNPTAGFQDTDKAGEEGTQTYVLFPVLSDGSTNPKNNKDAHTGGNKHNDDIQNCGDQSREQGDKAMNKDKVSAAGPSNAVMPNLEDLSHNAD
nr:retrovirus-related Pol polyprotein from transposon TNT 1-94 [Tanacetum cinerariifolium]